MEVGWRWSFRKAPTTYLSNTDCARTAMYVTHSERPFLLIDLQPRRCGAHGWGWWSRRGREGGLGLGVQGWGLAEPVHIDVWKVGGSGRGLGGKRRGWGRWALLLAEEAGGRGRPPLTLHRGGRGEGHCPRRPGCALGLVGLVVGSVRSPGLRLKVWLDELNTLGRRRWALPGGTGHHPLRGALRHLDFPGGWQHARWHDDARWIAVLRAGRLLTEGGSCKTSRGWWRGCTVLNLLQLLLEVLPLNGLLEESVLQLCLLKGGLHGGHLRGCHLGHGNALLLLLLLLLLGQRLQQSLLLLSLLVLLQWECHIMMSLLCHGTRPFRPVIKTTTSEAF